MPPKPDKGKKAGGAPCSSSGCSGEIEVRDTHVWVPTAESRMQKHAYCAECGLVYDAQIIMARGDYVAE